MSMMAPKKTVLTTGGPSDAIGLIALSSPFGCIVFPGKFMKYNGYLYFKLDPKPVKHWQVLAITEIEDFKVSPVKAKVTYRVKETHALGEEPH